MTVLDISKPIANKKIEAGTILILEGVKEKAMNILHSGLAEVLSSGGVNAKTASPEEIIENSRRVGLIRGESVYGILGIRNEGAYKTSIRAVTDCIVSINPVEQEQLLPTLQSKIKFNLLVLRAIIQRIESAIYLFKNYKYLWHKYASIADSIALVSPVRPSNNVTADLKREKSSLSEYSAFLHKKAEEMKILLPNEWDHNIFLGRIQQEMKLYDIYDKKSVETLVDYPQVLFIKRLVQKNDTVLIPLFKDDEPMNFYIFQFLCDVLEKLLDQNVSIIDDINVLIGRLFKENGWISESIKLQKTKSERIDTFNHYLEKFCWRCRQDSLKLLGIDLQNAFPIFANLKNFRSISINVESQTNSNADMPAKKSGKTTLLKYVNLLEKLLEFSEMNEDFRKEITINVNKFKNSAEKTVKNNEMIKLRTELCAQFWELYKTCFLKVIDTDLKGFIPGIFLHFGVLDETLLTDKELMFIDEAYSKNLYTDDSIPVITFPYFLEKIYRSELHPSISEMGESFRSVLKKQEKYTKSQRASSELYVDTAEDRVKYEIDKIAIETSKLLFGSKQQAVPFLFSEAFIGEVSRNFIDPDYFTRELNDVRKRDYSVFYREVILRHKYGTDIIKKEIPPYFVLYPGSGSRYMVWQELDGVKKDSPGRIFFPMFYSGSTNEEIPSVYAQFRWELLKTIAGVKWTDPVEGGLVGTYYDYINFYKKNPKLTPQAKSDLRAFIQKTKSDKDRFVNDYKIWVIYEYEGRLRMNPAVREIFYRFCPFPAEIRKEMAAKPLFSDLDMKYKNRIRKELLRAETRKRRFESANADIPDDLVAYLKFLDM